MTPTWIAVMTVALFACGSSADLGADGSDTDGPTSICCPIEKATCNCFGVGGTRENPDSSNQCSMVCDAEPDGWVRELDENGCAVLRFVGGTGSCSYPPDATVGGILDVDGAPPDALVQDALTSSAASAAD